MKSRPAVPVAAPAIRPTIANWFTEPEPSPRERVHHIRLALGEEGGFLISFRSECGDVEHVFEVADLNTLTDCIAMKRALRENTELKLDCPPTFWRNTVVPWLMNNLEPTDGKPFVLRPVPDRMAA